MEMIGFIIVIMALGALLIATIEHILRRREDRYKREDYQPLFQPPLTKYRRPAPGSELSQDIDRTHE